MSNSVGPHRRQPFRFPHPWDSPGKNTGVGCHFLLQCRKVKSESEVAQSCPTLRNPMDCSPPGSSVHGIFQARVLEWVAIAFSNCNVQQPLYIHYTHTYLYMCVCLVIESYSTLCHPMDRTHQALLSRNSPHKNTGVDSHFFLQGIFLIQARTQGSCIAVEFFIISATREN